MTSLDVLVVLLRDEHQLQCPLGLVTVLFHQVVIVILHRPAEQPMPPDRFPLVPALSLQLQLPRQHYSHCNILHPYLLQRKVTLVPVRLAVHLLHVLLTPHETRVGFYVFTQIVY